MTLGEFRKITEQYEDDCTLCWSSDINRIAYPNLVDRVIINIAKSTENEPDPVPNIVVL